MLVDFSGFRVTQNDIPILIENRNAALHVLGSEHVIVRRPQKILSRRQGHDLPEIEGCALISQVAMITYPWVHCGVTAADGFGRVVRRIIRDDEFEVPVRLRQDRSEALLKILPSIENWQADTDAGLNAVRSARPGVVSDVDEISFLRSHLR